MPAALRRRSGVLPIARRQRGQGLHRCACSTGQVDSPFRIHVETPRSWSTELIDKDGGAGAHHRLCAPLPDLWPHISSAAAHAHHRADRGHAARHHPLSCRASLRRDQCIAILRQQPHSRTGATTCRSGSPPTRRSLYVENEASFMPDAAGAPGVRHRRAIRRLAADARAAISASARATTGRSG